MLCFTDLNANRSVSSLKPEVIKLEAVGDNWVNAFLPPSHNEATTISQISDSDKAIPETPERRAEKRSFALDENTFSGLDNSTVSQNINIYFVDVPVMSFYLSTVSARS